MSHYSNSKDYIQRDTKGVSKVMVLLFGDQFGNFSSGNLIFGTWTHLELDLGELSAAVDDNCNVAK